MMPVTAGCKTADRVGQLTCLRFAETSTPFLTGGIVTDGGVDAVRLSL
jgi:hypothetical protein